MMRGPVRILALGLAAALLVSCAAVLGLKRGNKRGLFEHRAHVLRGITCETCHKGISKAGDNDPLHLPDKATCVSCHKKPHDQRDCLNCHGEEFARERAQMARFYLRFEHKKHVPRVNGNCVRCHVDVAKSASTLRPQMALCFNCHPHKDQFKVRKCDGCHINLPAESTRPTSHVVHDTNFIRRHGTQAMGNRDLCSTCHGESFCASCHGVTTATLPARMHFDRTMTASIHRAGFRSRHAEEARTSPGLCSTCHQQKFCADCHDTRGVSRMRASRVSQHGPGWVGLPGTPNRHGRAARINPIECASCHSGAGESLCIGCHKVGGIGGNPHPPGWSSRLNKHSDLPCRLCHGARR